ncbi:MAG: ABC transporter permease [Lachnospiraceae bacterium]|uniref:ABC transporter permease n=1 Tax=Bilifractor sp. LCP21S3_A7 TaxID=3438738 RepID=UPI002A0FFD83|nr:ABC transporter permease [Lachnospiraceae bacterium]
MEKAVKADKTERKSFAQSSAFRAVLPVIGLVLVFIIFNILTGGRMITNLSLTISSLYSLMIACTGVFFIMTMGGLDFSQGSILGIAGIVICTVSNFAPIAVAILAGIAAGAAIGAINGFFYVNRKIKSFIVTICTMFLFRGIIKYLTSNAPVAGSAALQLNYDTIPVKLTCMVIIVALGFFFFEFTRFGTDLKAIGAGEKAARFAGIRTDRMKFWVYVLSGAITGFAAFVSIVHAGSVTSSGGNQLETQILIALVLGGMPISGGAKVRFENVIVGALLYTILQSGLQMLGMSTQTMQMIESVIFLVFVLIFADRQSIQVIK